MAEEYRREVAEEWLGEELPDGINRVVIRASVSDDNSGISLLRNRGIDTITVKAPKRTFKYVLKHEVAHTVLDAYCNELPNFVHEGIASRYDGYSRKRHVKQRLKQIALQKEHEDLSDLVNDKKEVSHPRDYAISVSLVNFLLSINNDKKTLLEFGKHAKISGGEKALKRYYEINMSQLNTLWNKWIRKERQ